jgi:3',5'-cyclic AMP phosphodiesterase CpdA
VRLRGPVALIGVNSCVATGDLGAWGEIGAPQLERLEALLARRDLAERVRVVLVHHPPVRHKGGEHRNLRDRSALAAVLARAGADLVLHGHDHQDERARLNIYEIGAGAITLVTRAHDQASDRFAEVRRERLA